jgi:hypothetical protein
LEQRPGDVQAAAFAVAQLPAGLAHQLLEPCRRALEERAQTEGMADVRLADAFLVGAMAAQAVR